MNEQEQHVPAVGDPIQCDGWGVGAWESLTPADSYHDDSFPGCQFRLPGRFARYAVNVKTTGKPHYLSMVDGKRWYKSRVKVEFVGDGKPSVFAGGYIYHF